MDKLIEQAKRGENAAVEEIVTRYKGMVRSIANKFYLVGGDKDDLLQEGMLGLFSAINRYDEEKGSFPNFAKLCVLRQIINAVKRDGNGKNKPLYNYVELELVEDVSDTSTPLENFLRKEYAEKAAKVIREDLTSLERKALEMFAEGYNYEAIASSTGKSYKAIDGALQRARKKLLAFSRSYDDK